MSQQLGLPREVGVTARTKPAHRYSAVDPDAPDFVTDTGPTPLDASDVVTPLIESLPAHGHILSPGIRG
jgi:hypothetical protein